MVSNLKEILQTEIDLTTVEIALISTTAKTNKENRLLPPHKIAGKNCLNLMLNDSDLAAEIFILLDRFIKYFFIDVERKQSIDLNKIARLHVKNGVIIPYKPNDLTRDGAFFLIAEFFNHQLYHKKILIVGTGNIATKLALLLVENEVKVCLSGRTAEKLELIKNLINTIKPSYNSTAISLHSPDEKYDAIIAVSSGEKIINKDFISLLNPFALILDIGINNLTKDAIKAAQQAGVHIFRLDVRIASPIIEAMLQIYRKPYLANARENKFNNISCVSGGAIGKKGALIVDDILAPRHVYGIANGMGGLKNTTEYTKKDVQNLKKIQKILGLDSASTSLL